ncbi:sulfurtransferase complex subunit TusD [Buchnera aphidicola]|uniref:sulfurtransferase complex subunit TusD n=2 Tax=Buchnera aphidicola TaxID=9 RepID=UPI0031B85CA7
MKYMLLITGPVYGSQNALTGLLFARNAFSSGNNISSIFFYCNGVTNFNTKYSPSKNEFNLVQAWIDLNKKFKVKLNVCESASLRRGVISKKKNNIDKELVYFQLVGLIEIVQEMRYCDQIIQF